MKDDIRITAVKYIKSLSDSDRQSLKNMIKNGITCCISYAKENGINKIAFNNELKAIFSEE